MSSYLDFFCRHSTAVYRYHLARRGDELQAQALTEETFRAGLRWIQPDAMDAKEPGQALVRLMHLARGVQAYSHVKIRASALAPEREVWRAQEGRTRSESRKSREDEPAAQARDALLALVSGALRRLPASQADALALYFFAGLSPEQTAAALRANSERTAAWIQAGLEALSSQLARANGAGARAHGSVGHARGAVGPALRQELSSLGQNLLSLAAELQPAPAFVDGLEERLSALSARRGLQAAFVWRLAYNLRGLWGQKFSRLAPLGLLGLALAAGFYLTMQPTQSSLLPPRPSQPPAEGTLQAAPAALQVAADPNLPSAGWLVPVDLMTCETWRNRITGVTGSEASLDTNVPFNLPTQSGLQASGTACEINVTVANAPMALDGLSALLNVEKYVLVSSSGPNHSGVSQTAYQSPQGWVLVSNVPVTVAPGEAPPYRGGGNSGCGAPGYPCQTPLPGVQTHALYFDLAYDPISPILEFFSRDWIESSPDALNLLSSSLRQRITSISDLDQLAGYDRQPIHRLQITWRGLENAGKYLRLEATLEAIGQGALPSFNLGKLQVELSPDPEAAARLVLPDDAGHFADTPGHYAADLAHALWRIQALSRSDIFPVTHDAVLAAGSDGQIRIIAVDGGAQQSISGIGFYQPDLPGLGQQMRLSPDGRWLALNRSDGAWLLSLEGRPPRHLSMEQRYSAWSADSRTLAFFRASDPGQLYTQEVPDGPEVALARVDGRLSGLSWSPHGDFISFSFRTHSTPDNSSGVGFSNGLVGDWGAVLVQTRVALVNTTTGDVGVVQVHPFYPDGPGGALIDPLWTADNRELWFVSEGFAANPLTGVLAPLGTSAPIVLGSSHPVELGTLTPLPAGPAAPPRPGLPVWENPRYNLAAGTVTAMSPDSRLMAVAYYIDSLGYADTMAVQQYSSGQNLWIRVFGKVARLDWTEEGDNLIVVDRIGHPGTVQRINPLTGETIGLAQQVIYIGLRSSLQRNNQPVAPMLNLQAFPDSGPQESWHEFSSASLGLSLRMPADWDFREVNNILGNMFVVGNARISAWNGWDALPPDSLYITLNRIQMKDGQSPQAYLEDVIRRSGNVHIEWLGLTRSGQSIYMLSAPPWSNERASLVVLYQNEILWITKFPAVSANDAIFANIMDSIRLGVTPGASSP